MCLKLVNATSTPQKVAISLKGLGTGAHKARVQTMKGNSMWSTNTLQHPERIKPVASSMTIKGERLDHTMPGYSIQVFEVDIR